MTGVAYDPSLSMRDARAVYFAANGFGANGGYDAPWVDFKLGPFPFPFPNTKPRIEAVKFHDLHHIVTGYATDLPGELEISAWEIGAGCKKMAAAWVLNLGGMGLGLFTSPRRLFAAFVRGRRSDTLYGNAFDPLLDETVASVRSRFVAGDEKASSGVGAADVVGFALASAAGVAVGLTAFAMMLPLVPVGLVMNAIRKRSRTS